MLSLDSTCSEKRLYPKFASVRIDIRKEAKPDIVASACFLPFKDRIFHDIYCDPPHRIGRAGQGFGFQRSSKAKNGYARYGSWLNKRKYFEFLEGINDEFSRCLMREGILHFKTTEGSKSHGTMIEKTHLTRLSNFQTVSEEITESNGYFARANRLKGKSPSYVVFVDLVTRFTEH